MKKIFLFLIFITIISCDFVHKQKISGNFYLIAVDVDEQMSLSYKLDNEDYVGVIEETVFAVGYNNEYIVVKQHPRSFPDPPNKQVTNYYIVPIYKESTLSPEEDVIGPLNLKEFERKKKALNIRNIDFTIIYENLE